MPNPSNVEVSQAARLTRAQRQLLEYAAAGWTMAEIGAVLSISAKAVDNSYGRIRALLGARNGIEMVAIALLEGLIDRAAIPALRQQRVFRFPAPRRKAAA